MMAKVKVTKITERTITLTEEECQWLLKVLDSASNYGTRESQPDVCFNLNIKNCLTREIEGEAEYK